jgi:hypothetical protein
MLEHKESKFGQTKMAGCRGAASLFLGRKDTPSLIKQRTGADQRAVIPTTQHTKEVTGGYLALCVGTVHPVSVYGRRV